MRILSVLLIAAVSLSASAEIQSEFRGPIQLKVWQHWQQSWNVEDVTGNNAQFVFTRGTNTNTPFAELRLRSVQGGLQAKISCAAYVRTETWKVEEKPGRVLEVNGTKSGEWTTFTADNFSECTDKQGERIVTNIDLQVFSGTNKVFSYQLKPMYIRGAKSNYWNNPIDPHSAHAGSGQISVATAMTAENGWDKWNGNLVKPILNFVDRNTLSADSFIGLHRHEANQELYFVESGKMKMLAGVASRNGANYTVRRPWDSKGQLQDTPEFSANGGWIEERTLGPGEISVIVPTGADSNSVYFHGIKAVTEAVFWTMGSKN